MKQDYLQSGHIIATFLAWRTTFLQLLQKGFIQHKLYRRIADLLSTMRTIIDHIVELKAVICSIPWSTSEKHLSRIPKLHLHHRLLGSVGKHRRSKKICTTLVSTKYVEAIVGKVLSNNSALLSHQKKLIKGEITNHMYFRCFDMLHIFCSDTKVKINLHKKNH